MDDSRLAYLKYPKSNPAEDLSYTKHRQCRGEDWDENKNSQPKHEEDDGRSAAESVL